MVDKKQKQKQKQNNFRPGEWLNLMVSEPYYLSHFIAFFSYFVIRSSATRILSYNITHLLLCRVIILARRFWLNSLLLFFLLFFFFCMVSLVLGRINFTSCVLVSSPLRSCKRFSYFLFSICSRYLPPSTFTYILYMFPISLPFICLIFVRVDRVD